MTVQKEVSTDNNTVTAHISGRVDSTNSKRLETELKDCMEGWNEVNIDVKDMEYISSAGLRVFLVLQKSLKKTGGTLKVTNASDAVWDIFEVTGFTKILNVEKKQG